MKATRTALRWAFALASSALIAACGGSDPQPAMGTLRVAMTDAPACGFDEINVTVTRVRVHASDTATETSGGWQDIVVTPPRKVNLLGLTNGILEELGQTALPAGHYTQLRLVLQGNTGNTLANSVVPTGGTEQALDTPSGVQSGIKLINQFTVPVDGLADLILDFDACKSIVVRGNGSYGLKPVIRVSPRVVAEIVGNVDPSMSGTMVSAQIDGTVVRSTVPDPATGAFKLAYLNPAVASSVDVVITADDRASAVVSDVPIALQSSTRISTDSAPITLALSNTRTASGMVAPAAALPSVRALQTVGAVPTVEIAAVNADMTGAYTLTLPIAAPLLAPYATPLPLVFTPHAASAAQYRLEASADGYVAQTQPIDISTANATVDFTLSPAP
jgi:hypothetical protein